MLDEEGFLLEGEEKKDGNLIEIRFGWLYRDGHKLQLGQLRKEGVDAKRKLPVDPRLVYTDLNPV